MTRRRASVPDCPTYSTMCTVESFSASLAAVWAVLGTVLGVSTSLLTAFFARRSAEPSASEVQTAETLAEDAYSTPSSGATQDDGSGQPPLPGASLSSGDVEARRILTVYAKDLRREAARIAKRMGAEAPTPAHMRAAASAIGIMRQRASAAADIGLAVGGLVVGGAASFGINLWTGGKAAPGSVAPVVIAGAAGLVIFAISATVKVVRR